MLESPLSPGLELPLSMIGPVGNEPGRPAVAIGRALWSVMPDGRPTPEAGGRMTVCSTGVKVPSVPVVMTVIQVVRGPPPSEPPPSEPLPADGALLPADG